MPSMFVLHFRDRIAIVRLLYRIYLGDRGPAGAFVYFAFTRTV